MGRSILGSSLWYVPASMSPTRIFGFSDNRAATTTPAVPPIDVTYMSDKPKRDEVGALTSNYNVIEVLLRELVSIGDNTLTLIQKCLSRMRRCLAPLGRVEPYAESEVARTIMRREGKRAMTG